MQVSCAHCYSRALTVILQHCNLGKRPSKGRGEGASFSVYLLRPNFQKEDTSLVLIPLRIWLIEIGFGSLFPLTVFRLGKGWMGGRADLEGII